MMRRLLPDGLLPDARPVREQKFGLTPGMVIIPNVPDGVMLAGVLSNICERVDVRARLKDASRLT